MPANRSLALIAVYKPLAILVTLIALVGIGWAWSSNRPVNVVEESTEVDYVWTKTSDQGVYVVTLNAETDSIPLREFHEWTVEVRDANGLPVYPARFSIGGGMPGHGHGLPSQPRVSKHLADGKYLISGVKFNMAGDWLLLLDIASESQADRVSFEFQIDF
jgi:hypothetical protein